MSNPDCIQCYGTGRVGEGSGGFQCECPSCLRQSLHKKHSSALAAKDAEIARMTEQLATVLLREQRRVNELEARQRELQDSIKNAACALMHCPMTDPAVSKAYSILRDALPVAEPYGVLGEKP